jgi:hypothetical protein
LHKLQPKVQAALSKESLLKAPFNPGATGFTKKSDFEETKSYKQKADSGDKSRISTADTSSVKRTV